MNLLAQLPSATSRFKFCWLNNESDRATVERLKEYQIPVLNVGKVVARCIDTVDQGSNLSLHITSELSKELEESAIKIDGCDYPIVAIHNIGIVKERELKINFENILRDICRSICVILIWNDEYENGKFVAQSDYNSQSYLSFTQPITELSF